MNIYTTHVYGIDYGSVEKTNLMKLFQPLKFKQPVCAYGDLHVKNCMPNRPYFWSYFWSALFKF